MRLALYLRVSTDDQTVENQRQQLEREAAHRGWTITKVYIDNAISGAKTRADRPALDQLLTDTLDPQKPFDAVMVTALDRLGRNLPDIISTVETLKTHNVALVMLRESIDTTSIAGTMIYQIFGALAQFERAMTIERINAGIARAKAQGKNCGTQPYAPEVRAGVHALIAQGLNNQAIADSYTFTDNKGRIRHLSRPTVYRIRQEQSASNSTSQME